MATAKITDPLHQTCAQRKINNYRLQEILEHGGASILDVGCRSGSYILGLADERRIESIDPLDCKFRDQRASLFKAANAVDLPHSNELQAELFFAMLWE